MNEVLAIFVFFFAVVDPIGTVPVFISATAHCSAQERRQIAYRATGLAALVLMLFVIAGEIVLQAIQIPLEAFQIAGGIIIFVFAMTMVFGESKPEGELRIVREQEDIAVFPLAIPSIASPGAMLAAVLMTEKSRFNVLEQIQTSGIMLLVLLVTLGLMLASNRIHQVLGNVGASVISRIMGMLLASLAVSNVLAGISDYFNLATV